MQLKFGKGVIELDAIDDPAHQLSIPYSYPKEFGLTPRKFYAWSCKTDSGTPAHPPKGVRIDADIILPKASLLQSMDPFAPHRVQRNSQLNLANGSGFTSMAQVQKELNKLFPPQEITVPYDTLIEPFKIVDCMDLYAQQIYLHWGGSFVGQKPPADAGYFFFRIPLAVRFFVQVTDVCEGYLDEKYMTGKDATIRVKQNEMAKKLIEGHKSDVKDQRERAERWDEQNERYRED